MERFCDIASSLTSSQTFLVMFSLLSSEFTAVKSRLVQWEVEDMLRELFGKSLRRDQDAG